MYIRLTSTRPILGLTDTVLVKWNIVYMIQTLQLTAYRFYIQFLMPIVLPASIVSWKAYKHYALTFLLHNFNGTDLVCAPKLMCVLAYYRRIDQVGIFISDRTFWVSVAECMGR